MYDEFSADYDRFVDWPGRLAAELPFIERELRAVGARRVLDAACGTGMHALALAQRGYTVVGADLSAGMIEQARANAAAAGVEARFEVAGFGEMAHRLGCRAPQPGVARRRDLASAAPAGRRDGAATSTGFDALLCLGNSLPHVLTPADLAVTLADFAACLRAGGLLLIQNRNFDVVLARRQRWMEPQAHQEGQVEWLFLRFYDFEPDETLTFNLVTLRREGAVTLPGEGSAPGPGSAKPGGWSQQVTTTRLWPLRQGEVIAALDAAGFGEITCFGDLQGAPFDPQSSPNLVVLGTQCSETKVQAI